MRAAYFIEYYPWSHLQIKQDSCETSFKDFEKWFSNAFNPKSLTFYDYAHDRFVFYYNQRYLCCLVADTFSEASEKFFKSYIAIKPYHIIDEERVLF